MSSPISELEAAIDRLYQAEVAEFTEARNALASERKSAGDKDGAARVKALAKPTAVAWAVNQLYWRDRARFDALVEAMSELAAAQREALAGGGADALKEATRRKAARLQAASRAAEQRLLDNGVSGGPAVVQRLAATLEAAASPRPAGSELPKPGRLVAELQPAGFDLALGLGSLDLPPLTPRVSRPAESKATPAAAPRTEDVSGPARVRLQQAEFELARLRREVAAAERALREAESRTAAARADVGQLEARLQQTRARAEEKAAAEGEARRALDRARADHAAAEAALETLKRSR